MSDTDKNYNQDEVITRLIAEQTKTGKTIEEAHRAISSDQEFQGLTLSGGIRAIIRRYREEQEKNLQLEKEINRLVQQGHGTKNRR